MKIQKKIWGGGGQGGCERRIEVFVKIKKKMFFSGGARGRVWGGGVLGGCENSRKKKFGVGGRGPVGGGGSGWM